MSLIEKIQCFRAKTLLSTNYEPRQHFVGNRLTIKFCEWEVQEIFVKSPHFTFIAVKYCTVALIQSTLI